jgi:hypothetical protein
MSHFFMFVTVSNERGKEELYLRQAHGLTQAYEIFLYFSGLG